MQKHSARWRGGGFVVLLSEGSSLLEAPLAAALGDDLIAVEMGSPRFSRLNYDAVQAVVVDLPAETLLSSPGRRLMDALGRLAEESLALALIGPAAATGGAFLPDAATAALNLVPGTVVAPSVNAVEDLHSMLERLSQTGLQLLALDAPVAAEYDAGSDTVAVHGAGSALLAAFHHPAGGPPTARLHVLHDGMRSGWP